MHDADPLSLSALLRSRRAALGLSQAEIAERIDTAPATVGGYESGRRLPDAKTLGRLMVALKIPAFALRDALLIEAGVEVSS